MKAVTIPTNLLHELLALCEPEDHELRDRVTMSAANSAQAGALDAELMRDAERYRWLRDMNDWHSDPRIDDADGTKWQLTFYTSQSTEDQSDDNNLDSAIDAARAAQWGV